MEDPTPFFPVSEFSTRGPSPAAFPRLKQKSKNKSDKSNGRSDAVPLGFHPSPAVFPGLKQKRTSKKRIKGIKIGDEEGRWWAGGVGWLVG